MVNAMTAVERYRAAIKCEPVDRTVYANPDAGLLGKLGDPTYTPGDQYLRPEWAMDKIIEGAIKYDGDTMPNFMYYAGLFMKDPTGIYYLTPGKEIAKEMGPMAEETNPMKAEHLDFIIENGIQAWVDTFVVPKWKPEYDEEELKAFELLELMGAKIAEAGLDKFDTTMMPFTNGATTFISTARGYNDYLRDIRKNPEKLLQVSKLVNDWESENAKMIWGQGNWPKLYKTSMGRCDTRTVDLGRFKKFAWDPTIQYINDLLIDTDTVLYLHMDGNYDDAAELFANLRPKHTVVELDGFTNPEKVADVFVKNQICFEGDIPAAMLTLGTPDEVYDHCMKLKSLFGPGLILNAGCCHPVNTKIENLMAVREAACNMNY